MNHKLCLASLLAFTGCVDGGAEQEAPNAYPRTCAEAARGAEAADGRYKLYVDNDPSKPWGAYCADVGTSQPKEYLPVSDPNTGGNVSVYRAGGRTSGTDVVTVYDMLRVDPIALTIDTNDKTFAVSHGSLTDPNGETISSLQLGVAMTCGGGYSWANVSTIGTPFTLTNQFALGGDPGVTGHAGLWPDNKVVEIWADGDCGWVAPTAKLITLSYQ
jgi:hypothetical protein